MTRRRKLEQHRRSLVEIREIMNSMKTLAFMETRKLTKFLDAQYAVIGNIEDMAADFLGFYADTLPQIQDTVPVTLLIGSERGFVGDFNHSLLNHIELTTHPSDMRLIAIGRKLHSLLIDDPRMVARIDGAGVVDEVTTVLNRLVDELTALQLRFGELSVFCLYYGRENNIVTQKLLPPFQGLPQKSPSYSYPPCLNLTADEFIVVLTEHYLFAALYEILCTSLKMENFHRMTHLERAISHLDEKSDELKRQCNVLRQEEIIEEIEVILLSTNAVTSS